jgi:antitoxin (DNA-binding transcriptional repressor) of toxin-antitoxin stability system
MKELKRFTVEEFQEDFDDLIIRVEDGESFLITGKYGTVAIIPYEDYLNFIR